MADTPRATFRQVQNYRPEDPNSLQRQLSALESAVADAFGDVNITAAYRFVPTSLKHGDWRAQLQDMVLCAGTFHVTLPTATKMNAGRSVAVLVKSGTITVTSVTSEVQGAATDVLGTNGLRVYVSDGGDWWRAP
jgi:hypothetical protein